MKYNLDTLKKVELRDVGPHEALTSPNGSPRSQTSPC